MDTGGVEIRKKSCLEFRVPRGNPLDVASSLTGVVINFKNETPVLLHFGVKMLYSIKPWPH